MDEAEDLLNQHLLTNKPESGSDFGALNGGTTLFCRKTGVSRTFVAGEIVDNTYRLLEPIGHGGMGVVFSCYHIILQRSYAIKILSGDDLSGEHWARFKQEAQTLARLNHPGIVTIHNMGVEGGQWPYFVMELLTCESLNEQIKRLGKLTTNQALPLFIKVADALAQSHSQGIVHRDIKPGNLMLVKDGSGAISNIKIVDFGIARVLGNDQASQSQTATGMIFGTPYYMSPEQCSGLKVDQRSDIYSFGCALYETLTGRPPFVGNNAFETFLLHQTAPILLSTLDPRLTVIMERLLAKEPSARYQTMADVSRDLKRVLRGPGTASSAALKPATVPVEVVAERRGRFTKGQNIMMSLAAIAIGIITLLCQTYHQEAKKIVPLLTDSPRLTALPVPQEGSAAPPEMCELDNIKVLLYRESIAKNAFRRYGGTEQQLKEALALDYEKVLKRQEEFKRQMQAYLDHLFTHNKKLRSGDSFSFPPDLIMGTVKINDQVLPAVGKIKVPANSHVTLALGYRVDGLKHLFDLLGPRDINGLEISSENSREMLYQIDKFRDLDELCLFNPYIKMAPGQDIYDECTIDDSDLVRINEFKHLHSLGLSGLDLTCGAILRMQILNQLDTLKLKRVDERHIHDLLNALPRYKRLKEVWLIAEDLSDVHLEPLTKMANLETLHLERANITTQSFTYFARMKHLKHLYVDDKFSRSERARLLKIVPDCHFVPVLDYTYWQLHPGDHLLGTKSTDYKAELR